MSVPFVSEMGHCLDIPLPLSLRLSPKATTWLNGYVLAKSFVAGAAKVKDAKSAKEIVDANMLKMCRDGEQATISNA